MQKVLGVLQNVHDLPAMVRFFTQVLDFKEVANDRKMVKLQLGHECHYLRQSALRGRPFPQDTKGNDLWFQHIAIVVSDMDKAYHKLMQHGVDTISESPQTLPEWNKAAAGIRALYFRSPEGHPLELIWYPPGKGNSLWQNKNSLFLGIDHTAFTVTNSDASLQFYEKGLGMRVAGGSLNYGDTQEKLSGVPGAKVKITSLGFSSPGMGVEFLEYVHPTGGRKKPHDVQLHDLSEICTVMEVGNIEAAARKVHMADRIRVDSEMLQILGDYQEGLVVTDPDGHRIILI